MLEVTKTISLDEDDNLKSFTVNGKSKIDGVDAERYTASIDVNSLNERNSIRSVVNEELRDANREECYMDNVSFETAVNTACKKAKTWRNDNTKVEEVTEEDPEDEEPADDGTDEEPNDNENEKEEEEE